MQLPMRINSVSQYTNEAEANAEIRRIEGDLTQARQRVRTAHCSAPGRSWHSSFIGCVAHNYGFPHAYLQLQDMEMEARGLPEPTRKELGNKVRHACITRCAAPDVRAPLS